MGQVQAFKKWSEEFGPQPYRLALGSETMLVLPDPDDARSALLLSKLLLEASGLMSPHKNAYT